MRRKIAPGIYQDAHGISVIARIGSGARMKTASVRFPLEDRDGIPYAKRNCTELERARLALLEDLRRQYGTSTGAESLASAIDRWLEAHPHDRDAPYLLAPWKDTAIARLPVEAVTRKAIREQLEDWLKTGKHGHPLAPTSVNHRRRYLAHVLEAELQTDDDDAILPTDTLKFFQPRAPEERGIPMPIVARILANLPDRGRAAAGETRGAVSHSKIRLSVMAWTALPQKSLERLERARVRFHSGELFYPDRRKGKGAKGVWISLLPPAVDALRAFDAANLWGKPFSRSSLRKSWTAAVTRTRAQLTIEARDSGDDALLEQFDTCVPKNCRPYDLRHSFLSDNYRQSGDPRATQAIGQHASSKTTDRYTRSAVPERVAAAVDAQRARWFPDSPKPAAAHVLSLVKKTGA